MAPRARKLRNNSRSAPFTSTKILTRTNFAFVRRNCGGLFSVSDRIFVTIATKQQVSGSDKFTASDSTHKTRRMAPHTMQPNWHRAQYNYMQLAPFLDGDNLLPTSQKHCSNDIRKQMATERRNARRKLKSAFPSPVTNSLSSMQMLSCRQTHWPVANFATAPKVTLLRPHSHTKRKQAD